jgi:CheY-like chemotaxis protein
MNNAKILIVDDHKSTAKLLQTILTHSGYSVIGIVASGEEAIENALIWKPDLITMNVNLGGKIDGITTYEQIKKVSNVPVLFVSGHADAETIARAEQHNPCGYITKPFRNATLLKKVEKALGNNQENIQLSDTHAPQN